MKLDSALADVGPRAAALWSRLRPRRSGSRIVVIVGNEGAVLIRLNHRGVAERQYLPRPDREGIEAANEIFQADRHAPVTVLLDVLEQHYREAKIPNVNWNDRRKLLKRKLEQTYGADHLTSTLRQGVEAAEDNGEAGRRTERKYFLIGVPISEDLRAWLDVVVRAGNPVSGMALLPVEARDLVHDLAPADADPDDPPTWQILVAHHRASGVRQVVLKNGDLIFTRLTPNPEAEADTEELVADLQTEIRSTMSYLRRLSFTDADRLDLLVIADAEVARRLDRRDMRTRHMRTLTPEDAAEALDLNLNRTVSHNFSDDLMAAWYARQPSSRLRVDTPILFQARILSKVPAVAYTLCVLIAIGALAYGGWQQVELQGRRATLSELRAKEASLMAERDRLLAARPADQPPLRRTALVINTREALAGQTPSHAATVKALDSAVPSDMVVRKLVMVPSAQGGSIAGRAAANLPRRPGQPPPGPHDETALRPSGASSIAEITLTYRGELTRRQRIAARFEAFRSRLAGALPGYSVRLTQSPFGSDPQDRMEGRAGVASATDAEADRSAIGVYRVRGPE